MQSRISSTASSLVDLVMFSTICVGTLIFYGIKQLSTTSQQQSIELRVQDDRLKVIVITGCDRGLGRLMASEFSTRKGYLVVALTLTEQSAKEAFIGNKKIVPIKCDVTSDEDCQSMKQQVQSLLSEKNAVLYCIVNNAGIADPGDFAFHTSLAIPKKVMEVNFFGQLRVTQVLLPLMLSTSQMTGGKIINMSSVCGATASSGNSSYNASKFAVEAWSDSLKLELAPFGIQVVKIRPGQVQTEIQADWLTNFAKNFNTAPQQVRFLYGGEEYSNNVRDVVESMSDPSSMSNPQMVVDTVMDLLLQRGKLSAYYWVGRDAKTFWRALTVLPTPVGDLIKSAISFSPKGPKLPPINSVAYTTIRVRDVEKSLQFYTALGFETVGSTEGRQQFLQYNPSKGSTRWESLVLLKEDRDMPDRGSCSDAGYTRMSICCICVDSVVKELQSKHGVSSMAATAVDTKAGMKLAAFTDPDGFVIYFLEFGGIIGLFLNAQLWWSKRPKPFIFSLTINVTDHRNILPMFEKLGYGTLFEQNEKQIANDLLPAFKIDPATTVIERVRHSSHPNGGVTACVMDWTTPRTVVNSASATNSMTISVSDVEASIRKAKDLGMHIKDEKPEYRLLPIYGNVLVGTAFLEDNSCPIEFCCFTNQKAQ